MEWIRLGIFSYGFDLYWLKKESWFQCTCKIFISGMYDMKIVICYEGEKIRFRTFVRLDSIELPGFGFLLICYSLTSMVLSFLLFFLALCFSFCCWKLIIMRISLMGLVSLCALSRLLLKTCFHLILESEIIFYLGIEC